MSESLTTEASELATITGRRSIRGASRQVRGEDGRYRGSISELDELFDPFGHAQAGRENSAFGRDMGNQGNGGNDDGDRGEFRGLRRILIIRRRDRS